MGMESFFTLGLIALSYGLATSVSAYGFLSVFASGLAMRHVERRDSPAGNVDPFALKRRTLKPVVAAVQGL